LLEALEERRVLTVTFHGGPLLPNVEIEGFYFGQQWTTDPVYAEQSKALDSFLKYLPGSTYLDMLTQAGYGVGRGTYLDSDRDLATLPTVLSDGQIQAELQLHIDTGFLQAPDANRLYVVYVAPNVEVTLDNMTSGQEPHVSHFAGYHDCFFGHDRNGNQVAINYAVIPYPGGVNGDYSGSPLDSLTEVSSHEIAEGVTDPEPSQNPAWYDDRWVDPVSGDRGGEIGDIVAGQDAFLNGWMIQAEAGIHDQALYPAGAVWTLGPTFTATGQDFLATRQRLYSGTVATFDDTDGLATLASFSAQIGWGDGQVSAATISDNGDGTFSVSGAHTYSQTGTYSVSIVVLDNDGGSAAASATATVGLLQDGWDPAQSWSSLGGFLTSVSAVRNADGRLEVFGVSGDHAVWHTAETSPGGSWGDWHSLGGWLSAVSAVRHADGRLEVFGIAGDHAVWHDWQLTPGGAWSGWNSLGGWLSALSAVANADGRLEVFAVGGDHAIWHKWEVTPGGSWTDWTRLGGWLSSISATANADGRLEIFGVGGDHAVWHTAQTTPGGGWSDWHSLSGWLADAAAIVGTDGRLHVFGIGSDQAVWQTWQIAPGGPWSDWTRLGGTATDLSATSTPDGRLALFVVGSDNSVWQKEQVQQSGSTPSNAARFVGVRHSAPAVTPLQRQRRLAEKAARDWLFRLDRQEELTLD
jgi:hypothetical protein